MIRLSIEGRLKGAVRLAFVGGAFGALSQPTAALAQSSDSDKATQLQGVTVTGSLVRRVDNETANPVTTVSRKAIEQSGVTTVGQLLEQLPSLTGDALTPQVNNGGAGDGASTISLRGLGAERTLILLDGKRVVTSDVNVLPVNMIDHVEVLNEGAGTVYGSDAVGGVVNFITRKNFTGTEITGNFGIATDKNDEEKVGASFTTGMSSSKGHMVLGISYDNNGAVKAKDRDVGKIVLAYLYGQVSTALGGSSRIPTGRFYTSANGNYSNASGTGACTGQLTRIDGTDGSSAADFRCRTGADIYNYQTENLLYTPNDHIQMFALGSESFTDNLKGYANLLFNRTGGHNQLAPEAFDSSTLTDPNGNQLSPVISQYSMYNPLGADVTKFTFRATETGDRVTHANEDIVQGTLGLKATLFDRFEWDNSLTYGREDDTSTLDGYLNVAQLNQQLGPSEIDPYQYKTDGHTKNPHYGQATCFETGAFANGTQINGCTPVNILGTWGNGYSSLSKPVVDTAYTDLVTANSNISGELFNLPAGAIQGAAGVEWRQYRLDSEPDQAAQLFQLSESNSTATKGSYNVREVYGEFLIPVLKDLPGAKSLNIDAGVRWSSYSDFGSTTNGKYALEYRPIKDLLVRATYSDIFRAPTIGDLYSGRANSAPIYTDVCNSYGVIPSTIYPHLAEACQVAGGGTVPVNFQQPDAQGSTTVGGNTNLKPETGYTTDFGMVYSPEWYKPLSIQADFWNYRIHDAIEALGLQTYQVGCAASGDPGFCGNGGPDSPFYRDSTGQVIGGLDIPKNIGTFFTNGYDFGITLNYPKTRFGAFVFDFNGTYLDKLNQTVKGSSGQDVLKYSLAGQNSGSFVGGGYPRLKFTSSLDWSYQSWDVVLRNRFVATEADNGGQDGIGNNYGLDASGIGYAGNKGLYEYYGITGTGRCNEGGDQYTAYAGGSVYSNYICKRSSGYADYQDMQVTYKAKPLHTDFTVGVNDIFDEGAQYAYTYGPAFNYDASNYDVTGRFVYGRVKVYFK